MPEKDEKIKQHIIDHLTWDASVNASEVNVSVKNGKVELRGNVQNYTARVAAERNAYQVSGVTEVSNFLDIRFPPTQTMPSDDEINDNISRILSWNGNIDVSEVAVSTEDNVVQLKGEIGSYWEKNVIEEILNGVRGVVEVKNQLSVKPKLKALDINIKNDIESAFERTNLINEDNIDVEVNKAVVTLKGAVRNFFIKSQAHNIAIYTTGVVDVVDEMTVS